MATSLPWHPLLSASKSHLSIRRRALSTRQVVTVQAFRRSDFDGFAKRVTSGEAWRDAWRSANDGFEQFLFDAKKTAERLDRQYSVSRRLNAVMQSATDRAREIDRELEIGRRWRSFTLDFSRNWPRYRRQLNDFLDTPLGRSFATVFFLWFALSGWLFRVLIFATWVLPFAAPLLIGTVANNFVIEGACPACKRRFMGYKNQVVRCASCGNIVWQPKGDFFSGGSNNTSSTSGPDIIDVEFEEK
ncbi:PREDICTED: uncharacterized protein LOC104606424 [Nelumbo nucifera]|uniref:Uncharacterized protein LOC104606424 n=2 Tax=Nelumbo nucifera TaxID=4432 RepID=A0A1U8B1U8_NELNU|nr:PREDICTED: uncharacterized protein LOC104606424 [Nelumbo nucifera]DAD47573.1 TPA_asm: hypothetical protein HUJ06_017510 [Nelumbo nucifera]